MRYFIELQDNSPINAPMPENIMAFRFPDFDADNLGGKFAEFIPPAPDADLTNTELFFDGEKVIVRTINV